MRVRLALALLGVAAMVMGSGCASTRPTTIQGQDTLSAQVNEAVALFKSRNPGIIPFFENSYGYAVFPQVTKGAWIVGTAFGRGEAFAQGTKVGYCSLSQATLGFSFGGEFFREIIFFQDEYDLERFATENFAFSGQMTAVALTAGAAVKVDYQNGMAVFVMPQAGLMVDASMGGQAFEYEPILLTQY